MKKGIREVEVTIPADYPLKGTLALPSGAEGTVPAILLVAGTGKSDRNGNGGGIDMNIYQELADHLTRLGYATLRYDKRGTHQSEGSYDEAGFWDYVADARACVRLLKSRPEIDASAVAVLGHSEGAMIAPASFAEEPVAGMILLAGTAEDGESMLTSQGKVAIRELEESKGFKGFLIRLLGIPNKARKQNAKLFATIRSSTGPTLKYRGVTLNAKWFREHLAFDVKDSLPSVTCPVLAVTGEKDIQVPPQDVKTIAELVAGEAEWKVIPRMNHILRAYDGTHSMLGVLKEYKTLLNEPIMPELLDTLADWLARHLPAGSPVTEPAAPAERLAE
ncbi:alpha/beta hydrolase [Paenibacillus sp. J31TS4]|uniref:alpha/beta hydrolase n=1 Tax=Paenibacillus sp. J31TS4 TaxID=2807195 RepID=UPI001B021978|nr:alpha/beta fold hydrolase [Paenibacillus sp. J31TS4]GIP37243.1 alpha/beta hydrolase [Paenibacillus sp. J31TS4]